MKVAQNPSANPGPSDFTYMLVHSCSKAMNQ